MTDSKGSGWTRRSFLEMAGKAGGAAAVYESMVALGLLKVPAAWAGPPEIPKGIGAGQNVVILGAGIAGLTAAYWLRDAGYNCLVLEAQALAGGRSLTARRGTKVTEIINSQPITQTCEFDPDPKLYLNLGPGRIPYHHRRVLDFCQKLKVSLEVYVMETTANVLYGGPGAFAGEAMVNRRIANDTRGYVAELLHKAVADGDLDAELPTQELRDLFKSLLTTFGDLQSSGKYTGSSRSGCTPPSVYQNCPPPNPLTLDELLKSRFWDSKANLRFYQPVDFLWQPTLFQPVGGMDMLVKAFETSLGAIVRKGCAATAIEIRDDSVAVTYTDQSGSQQHVTAHYCISNIPLPVLRKIPVNFEPRYKDAVQKAVFDPSCKVGWQAERRFWELDKEIYGGISWSSDPITQMWYPSNDWLSEKGTLTGAYNYGDNARSFGAANPPTRLAWAREQGARLHKPIADPGVVGRGISIAWQNVPYQMGAWANWANTGDAYGTLLAPDRRFFFTGDQVSQLPGWQEGAMMSAEHVVRQITRSLPMAKEALEAVEAPDTRALVEGSH
jgi:monoamine oxidase